MGWSRGIDIAAKLEAERVMRERINARACPWPDCGCCGVLERWALKLMDEEKTFPMNVLDWAECEIFIVLACVGKRCSDPIVKSWAKAQLEDVFWLEQKVLSVKGWQ
jgi:hypothetical protein